MKLPSILAQVHLAIKLYAIGSTGILGANIRVATPVDEYDRPESIHFAEAEIETNYNELESFAKQLDRLINQETSSALLKS